MTPTLSELVCKEAEFDPRDWVDHVSDLQNEGDISHWGPVTYAKKAIEFENARLLPLVKRLAEELEALATGLEMDLLKLAQPYVDKYASGFEGMALIGAIDKALAAFKAKGGGRG